MSKLTCILDTCPKCEHMVDWRRCQHCGWYGGEVGVGKVECKHNQAQHNPDPARMEAIRAMAGCAHVTMVGPMRSE